MALTFSPAPELGTKAPEFDLPGVDGRSYSLESFKDSRALVVVFMCNHCPYVVAVQDRINAIAREYDPKGVALIGINSNDPIRYPEDDFDSMKKRASEQGYVFPYVQDLSQSVARAYGAVCTPDPFVYERVGSEFLLRYRGRIDDNWKDEKQVKNRELAAALDAILSGAPVDPRSNSAMGCSIKWRN